MCILNNMRQSIQASRQQCRAKRSERENGMEKETAAAADENEKIQHGDINDYRNDECDDDGGGGGGDSSSSE